MENDFAQTNFVNSTVVSKHEPVLKENVIVAIDCPTVDTVEVNLKKNVNSEDLGSIRKVDMGKEVENDQKVTGDKLKILLVDLPTKLNITDSGNSQGSKFGHSDTAGNTELLSPNATESRKIKSPNLLIASKTLSLDNASSSSSSSENLYSKLNSTPNRPIYPDIPYSPYSSPRCLRKRVPLKESKRVSIERQGSFLQLNQYKLMESIGQGSYGLVKLAYSEEDSTHYAMKILSKRRLLRKAGLVARSHLKRQYKNPLERVYREIAVLKKLDHPNVVKLIEVLDDPLEDSLYLVFELVKNGEILNIPTKNPLTEERARECFRDVILGVEYLHYQCIIHGDLKPANLLLGECGRIIIADLGVCDDISECGDDKLEFSRGTPAFRSPESLCKDTRFSGKAADIWSLGVTLYALVFGDVPFNENSLPALYESIQSKPLIIPETPNISNLLKNLITALLDKNPLTRLPMSSIKIHDWVTNNGKEMLPSEKENCRLVHVTDEELQQVVTSVPKLDTLILIKTMLKKHSFQNPFLRHSSTISAKEYCRTANHSFDKTKININKTELTRTEKSERFVKAGRSNSAPMPIERKKSNDNILPSLEENVLADFK